MHTLTEKLESQRRNSLAVRIAANIIFFGCVWAIYSTGAIVVIPMLMIALIFANFAMLAI
jgi:fatty acid desaturase